MCLVINYQSFYSSCWFLNFRTSSRPDIVQVIPLNDDEGCSIRAVVSAATKEPIRNTVIVLAEEMKTGFILRCDVIVDVIKSLAVTTTTRELYMEEAPEMFEVRADDNQGTLVLTWLSDMPYLPLNEFPQWNKLAIL